MKVQILLLEKNLKVEFEDVLIPEYVYQVDGQINLTDLVKEISNVGQKLVLIPENYNSFKINSNCEDASTFKIIEYIFKILEAYNRSYDEVFPTDKESIASEINDA